MLPRNHRPRHFVAWDGEGVTRRGRHDYVLFAGSLPDVAPLVDARGLSTVAVLDALLAGFAAAPLAVHVGFAISYDVNMLLRDVPARLLKQLWAHETVVWRPTRARAYKLTWRPRKFLRVQSRARPSDPWRGGTWWDVWPFFQCAFVPALKKYGVVADDVADDLACMKAQRSGFRARDLPRIQRYNAQELTSLVALMRALASSLDAAGLTIGRWDGPGALAAALLTRERFADTHTSTPPDPVLDAAQYAYYGGRIECVRYGHLAPARRRTRLYHYDLNSAYPAAMQHLPCRRAGCGRWVMYSARRTPPVGAFAVHRVVWDFAPAVVHPFPWRSARGGVYFPAAGDGWVWEPEYRAALAHGLGAHIQRLETWAWRSNRRCRHETPTAWIAAWYERRQEAKRRGDAAEHAIKLALNSLYGKTAQRVGAVQLGDDWRTPPHHDLCAAGWVTSTVRAQLYTAAMHDPGAVCMLATDAIFSMRPLSLDVASDKRLGAWDFTPHTGATIVQSGVYWTDDSEGTALYSRGFDASSVRRAAVLRGWRTGAVHVRAAQSRFVGLGRALASGVALRAWRTWTTEPRQLALHPWGTKRTPPHGRGGRARDASRGLVLTAPADTSRFWADPISGRGRMTTPTAVPWRALPGLNAAVEFDAFAMGEEEAEDATL